MSNKRIYFVYLERLESDERLGCLNTGLHRLSVLHDNNGSMVTNISQCNNASHNRLVEQFISNVTL